MAEFIKGDFIPDKGKITKNSFIEVDKWDKVDGKLQKVGRMILPIKFFQPSKTHSVKTILENLKSDNPIKVKKL